MSLFSGSVRTKRFGALIEIGSGSVITSIVCSDPAATHPEIVWARREFASLPIQGDFTQNQKNVLAALVNCVMLLDSEGRSALHERYGSVAIDTVQVSISAPWSHTISKVITYTQNDTFSITTDLIDDLIKQANEQTVAAIETALRDQTHQLTIMTRATTDITANGYQTFSPIGQTASRLTLTQVSAVADTLMTDAVADLTEHLFAKAQVERYSTTLMYHCIARELYGTMTEYCLVDITYEATELAIVRDGVLQYATFTLVGINTMVRNIAHKLGIPEADADSMLKAVFLRDSTDTLPPAAAETIALVLAEYEQALTLLFTETGDSLTIPKVLFLHSNYHQERYLDDVISAAAKKVTCSTHTVHTLTTEIYAKLYSEEATNVAEIKYDTSVIMAAQFFHKQHHCNDFTQV
jgi:cell division ATPase FtsA